MNNKSWVFGNKIDSNKVNAELISEVLADAFERVSIAAAPDIECILAVLDKVSEAWANPEYSLRKQAKAILPSLTMFSSEMIEEGLNVVSALCSAKNLRQRLRGELGHERVLDEGIEKHRFSHRLKAKGRGVVVHLTAGNVFVGAVDSLVSGIITKNVNILKMSRVDTVFPILFLESIREHDPAGVIWPNQVALLWKGGDEEIEQPIFNAPLTIVFWGGLEALQSLKSRIGIETNLIENGPRLSFAVVEGRRIKANTVEDMAQRLALDIARWDQQACSSPHVIYVIDKDVKSAHLLLETLFDELIGLSETLPVGELSFDEKVEIRKVRELARMAQARGEARLECPESFDFTLVLEYDAQFKVSCLNRTVFIKRVASLEELLIHVEPLGSYLQTVGVEASPELLMELEDVFFELGAKRVTELGGMSEGSDGAPHEGDFFLNRLTEKVAVEHRVTAESRLQRLLSAIGGSEYYGGLFEKVGGCGIENFSKLPLLDRETFFKHSPPDSNAILTREPRDAYVYASGGTTGTPKFSFYSNEEYVYVTDILTDIYRNAGLCEDDRVANLFIAGNLWTSFNVAGRALENLGCLNLPVGGASDMDNIINYIKIFDVNAIVGLPSIIIALAEEIERRGVRVRIEKVLYGGEHLRPQTCEYLERVIGAKMIRSAGYACVDTGPVGWQCACLENAVHHVLDDYVYCEILDPVTGEAAAEGELVVTNLNKTLMPIVRYRTGDMGRWVELGPCECGFKGRSFELLGRCDEMVVIGGINLLVSEIAAGLSKLPVSQVFQMVARTVHSKDYLCLRLEAEKPLPDKQVLDSLIASSYKIAETMGKGWMNIGIEWFKPGEMPRNPRTGKVKVLIDERL